MMQRWRRDTQYLVAGSAVFLLLLIFYLPHFRRGTVHQTDFSIHPESHMPRYTPGLPKPLGATYSKTLVVARMDSEDVSWLDQLDAEIKKAVYVVDRPALSPGFEVPKNKGHEAMVYLTYIIDHYDNLSDTTIFVHAHQTTWHNNDLLDSDMLSTIAQLSDAHVARSGYFNLRCHHEPGCPDWLHLDRPDDELDTHRKMEERTFSADVWHELHPGVSPPHAISQPCCAQFAVSRDRIRANPISEYVRYRDWILSTKLSDTYSGRIMEYSWQYVFAGVPELCPEMHKCYCDGYGACFGGATEFENWFDLRKEMRTLSADADELAGDSSRKTEAKDLRDRAHEIDAQLAQLKTSAFVRGQDPKARAEEVGRPWRGGDGY